MAGLVLEAGKRVRKIRPSHRSWTPAKQRAFLEALAECCNVKLAAKKAGDFKVRTKFRLLPGDEDQPVDPLIASIETLGETPAYRGLALAIFEDLELAEFGNRIPVLTFEVVAETEEVPLARLLADASGDLIDCDDQRRLPGYAAHGTTIGDGLRDLIDLAGVRLAEQDGRLASPAVEPVIAIAATELGCDSDGGARPANELDRGPTADRPATLALTYYDPDRDYQAGQVRSSGGGSGLRDERVELPAVLTAAQARQLVEEAYARRGQSDDKLKLRLPPSRMDLRPGRVIQLEDSTRAWLVRAVSIEGMAVAIEADEAPASVPALPAASGRAVAELDIAIGRTELAIFELPATGDAPDGMVRTHIAGSNNGLWKPVPVELIFGGSPHATNVIDRRAALGTAESVLDARVPLVLDEISSVAIRLCNPADHLLNADDDALMAGANLAVIGNELVQFGRAEQQADGLYRLSKLLRGRRGTEWAAMSHAAGDRFCMIDGAATALLDLPMSSVATTLAATAHGIADVVPLPSALRLISGESIRPPSPCHLALRRAGSTIMASWIRRSLRGWTWSDGVGVSDDPFPELYRLTFMGPAGEFVAETPAVSASFDAAELPAAAGEDITLSVATIGPSALSHPTVATITL